MEILQVRRGGFCPKFPTDPSPCVSVMAKHIAASAWSRTHKALYVSVSSRLCMVKKTCLTSIPRPRFQAHCISFDFLESGTVHRVFIIVFYLYIAQHQCVILASPVLGLVLPWDLSFVQEHLIYLFVFKPSTVFFPAARCLFALHNPPGIVATIIFSTTLTQHSQFGLSSTLERV